MNSDLANLRELQKEDAEVFRLNQEIASLPRRVAAIEDKLAIARARKQEAEAALKADEASRRKLESQIQDLRQKISKYRDQMLDVKTNDQYRALTTEVDFAQKEIRACEDKILDGMVNSEEKEKQLKVAEAELKAETAEIEREKAAARVRTEEDQALLAAAEKRRQQLRSVIDGGVLHQYERVAKLRGTGLAEAIDHRCSACQVMIRPQVWNDIQAGNTVLFCETCQRVLVFDATLQTPPPEEKEKSRKHAKAPAETLGS
jgi:predicted  nucleic acid-binding Zn-ribbon protein